ncbi:MAG: hypothetical protein M1548_03020 [Actinobacteria bacterium]|nr:hypothetical protein [Actinomycetota bacterium]
MVYKEYSSTWRSFALICLLVTAVLISVGIGVALVVAVAKSPTRGATFIQALQIMISWPVIIGALVLAAGLRYPQEIGYLIRNVRYRTPSGGEIFTNQPEPPPGETEFEIPSASDTDGLVLGEADKAMLAGYTNVLQEQLEEKYREAFYWWCKYLSVFLVPTTQLVLAWFEDQSIAPTKEFYNEFWKTFISDSKQRETMLMVLLHHQLLESDSTVIRITEAGRSFLAFTRGIGQPHESKQTANR